MPNEMAVLDGTGDTKIIWDPDKPDEVSNARATFNVLKEKKYRAYYVNKDGKEAGEMKKFDPKAEKMIMVGPVVGG